MGDNMASRLNRLLYGAAPPDPPTYFSHLPQIRTRRLTLRPLRMSDARDMNAYASDPEVARHVLWDAHRTMMDTRGYLRFIIRQYRQGQPSSWGIVHNESGKVIGTIGFMSWTPENGTVEVGYSMARSLWGQGLMTEALRAVLHESFITLKMHRVEAMHFTENPASGRVMEKCGMTHEGRMRQRIWNKGAYHDTELWAILRADWLKQTGTQAE